MSEFKVSIDNGCISCGNCQRVCPEMFEVLQKAKVKTPNIDELKCAMEAAEQCPVSVIHITDTKTNKKLI